MNEEAELEKRLGELVKRIKGYNERVDEALLRRAWEFGKLAHVDQRRMSGELVLAHTLAVAEILAEWRLDSVTIAAGLLHEAVEEGGAKCEDLREEFGEEVAGLVEREEKVAEIRLSGGGEEELVENLRRMVLAMAADLRVVWLKLASRLQSLETLGALPKEEQKRIAKETLEIYAPLAERLGMGEAKGQLEDAAFPFVYPEEYEWIVKEAKPYYRRADEQGEEARREILRELREEGVRGDVRIRKKRLYSLWRKLNRPGLSGGLEEIHDIVAVRILVESVEECYIALGVVHKLWKPVPKIGVRDFIALPKPNGYRSIHTTVFGPEEREMEVQIRTWEMHEEVEYGMAAHWYYSQAKAKGVSDEQLTKGLVFAPEEKLRWVKQLAEWQKEVVDTKEFLETLKVDALAKRIFVLSPRGDAYDLPEEATPVDFAYGVHGSLGRRMVGAKVNGKMVGLDYPLSSGDVVEILESKEDKMPTASWLVFVKTGKARKEIEKHLKRARRRDTIRE